MLGQWCCDNGMSFNEMKTSRSWPPVLIKTLESFSLLTTWSNHISSIVKNAYKTLGLIRRSFSASVDTRTRRDLYLYLVRSQLLYCSLIWRPYLIKDIKLLEQVQRRATKYILNDYVSDYKSRLISLNMLPLMMVLELNDLSFFINNTSKPSPSFDILNFIRFSDSSTRFSSQSKLLYASPSSSKTRHSYFNRLPRLWNRLPYIDPNLSAALAISRIKIYFWDQFLLHFDSSDVCSYHL
uniref:Reverse transcriptase domain-containing protein n=1 Tax=Amphimedon queenslandica TaxID=400682 RepID=A0A1X7U4I4_AMPQE